MILIGFVVSTASAADIGKKEIPKVVETLWILIVDDIGLELMS